MLESLWHKRLRLLDPHRMFHSPKPNRGTNAGPSAKAPLCYKPGVLRFPRVTTDYRRVKVNNLCGETDVVIAYNALLSMKTEDHLSFLLSRSGACAFA